MEQKCGMCGSNSITIINNIGYKKYRCLDCWHEGLVKTNKDRTIY